MTSKHINSLIKYRKKKTFFYFVIFSFFFLSHSLPLDSIQIRPSSLHSQNTFTLSPSPSPSPYPHPLNLLNSAPIPFPDSATRGSWCCPGSAATASADDP